MKFKPRPLTERDRARLVERARGTIAAGHSGACRFLISVVGAMAIECEHGFDSCPMCDSCNCERAGQQAEKVVAA